jgi:hypothetical protein
MNIEDQKQSPTFNRSELAEVLAECADLADAIGHGLSTEKNSFTHAYWRVADVLEKKLRDIMQKL